MSGMGRFEVKARQAWPRARRRVLRGAGWLALPLVAALAVGCGDNEAPKPRGIDSLRVRDRLPSGRFQIPTTHTPAPDLWISLPEGYTVKGVGKMPNDEFYIFSKSDPTLKDPSAVSTGFLRIYIGVMTQSAIPPGRAVEHRAALIAGHPFEWSVWSDTLADKRSFLNREITSDDFFASISPELARAPLHLHIYVGGTDSAHVADLEHAAQTLAITP